MKRKLLIAAPFVLLAAALFGIYRWSGIGELGSLLAERRAQARQLGLATTPAELEQLMAIPPGDNAAIVYEPALKVLASRQGDARRIRQLAHESLVSPLVGRDLAEASRLVNSFKPELDTLARGSLRKGLALRTGITDRDDLMNYSTALHVASYGLAVRALVRASKGETELAVDDLEAVMRIARQISKLPDGFAALSTTSLTDHTLVTLDRVTLKAPHSEKLLQRALHLVDSTPFPDYRRVLSGELVWMRQSLADIGTGKISNPAGMDWRSRSIDLAAVRNAIESKNLKTTLDLFVDLPADPSNIEAAAEAFVKSSKRASQEQGFISSTFRFMPQFESTPSILRTSGKRQLEMQQGLKSLLRGEARPLTLLSK